MLSSEPDDYASLISPWKPIAAHAVTNITGLRDRIEVDHSTKIRDVAKTDSTSGTIGSNNDAQREDSHVSKKDSINDNLVLDHEAQQEDSEMEDSGIGHINTTDVDDSIVDEAQIDGTDASIRIDTKCTAVLTCVANSGDHRKVVSHIFGRNKACTRGMPNNLWIFWCRKHYQRHKYRAEDVGEWHTTQLGLVRDQLQLIEDWGEVRTWTITLRKAEQNALAKEERNGITTYTNHVSSCWERFLVPYLGSNKTFAQVREVLRVIERKFNEAEYLDRPKKLKTFPGVEFLPTAHKAKRVAKPARKKGGIAYRKITLDQPAFNRKTRANTEAIKHMAARKAQASHSPKGSAPPSKKRKSPNTHTPSTSKKRKPPTPASTTREKPPHSKLKPIDVATAAPHSTAPSKKRNPTTPTTTAPPPTPTPTALLPNQRRRLARGYEKHASAGEDPTGRG